MSIFREIFESSAKQFDIRMSSDQIRQFKVYLKSLLEFNQHTNLTSITDPGLVAIKHFIDSLLISKVLDLSTYNTLIDIGTGAGFPGMPVKILFPKIKLTLVDSLSKKVNFLNELKVKLNVEVEIFHKRAEELSKIEGYRDHFDVAVSRAVASLNVLSEYCMPFVKEGGFFVAMKGPDVNEELENAKSAINKLGGEVSRVEKFELPGENGKRSIILIKKIHPTSDEYPRSVAKIIKKPL